MTTTGPEAPLLEPSILKSTKKLLNISEDDDAFDTDIILHINSSFSDFNDLGVGPEEGFMIAGDTEKWSDFLGDDFLLVNSAQTLMYLKVRMVFDPPTTGYLVTAYEKMIEKNEVLIRDRIEVKKWSLTHPQE